MKFALINPNWTFDGSIYFGCREAHLPLELGYSAALLAKAGHTVEVIDGQLYDLSIKDIKNRVREFEPDFTVVTSAPSYLFWRCAPPELTCPQQVIDAVKPWANQIVLVGPHASTTPYAALRKTGADIVIAGECEEVLSLLAEPDWHNHPSIGSIRDGKFSGADVRHASNMATLPALKWTRNHLQKHTHHHHRFDVEANGWGAEMETSRGCPYACSFCAKDNFRNKYRKRPLPVILEELDGLIAEGATYVYFVDEIFLPNKDLLEALKTREIQFGVQTRIDLWDFDMLQLLGEAGCVSIEAGVESITEEGRAELNKNCKMSTDSMTERLVYARKYVPFVQGNLIEAGTDEMQAVEDWRAHLLKHGVWANKPVPLFPYPGSPDYTRRWGVADDMAWERAHEHYLKLYDDFSDVQNTRPLRLSMLERPVPNGKQPFRLLMTCDAVGGVWTYTIDLCRTLARQGTEILLAVLGPEMSREQRREADSLTRVQVVEHAGKLEWMEDPWTDVEASGKWLLDLARQFKPDIVHLNGYSHANLKWDCPVIVVAHSCIYSWWKAVKGAKPPACYNRYHRTVQSALDAATTVVAPTRAVLNDLKDLYDLDGLRRVIYNGRDMEPVPMGPRERFIFSAGRVWDEAKNFATLNEVATHINWPVIVAGDSTRAGHPVQFKNLRLVGKLDQQAIRTYYKSAAIFVSPAYYEPFGLCILEAALSGCPLVLSDLDSLREIWQDNAIFVQPDDPEQLRVAINTLIEDEVMRQSYGARAQARARQFTAGKMAQEYLHLYQHLTKGNTNELLVEARARSRGSAPKSAARLGDALVTSTKTEHLIGRRI